jgi:hypothetical protein
VLLATVLDSCVPIGDHPDKDVVFRAAVDRHLHEFLAVSATEHQRVSRDQADAAVHTAVKQVLAALETRS